MSSRPARERDDALPEWTGVDAPTQQSAPLTTTEQVSAPVPSLEQAPIAGVSTVADRVVAEIIERAVSEVTGVHALIPRPSDPLRALVRRLVGRDPGIPGIGVRVRNQTVAVSLSISVTYGASIPAVVDSLQRYVTARLETLTGLGVREVRITVSGLAFPADSPPAPGLLGAEETGGVGEQGEFGPPTSGAASG